MASADGLLSTCDKPCEPEQSPSKASLIELLESQLAEERRSSAIKDQRIAELQARLAALEKQLAGVSWSTTSHAQVSRHAVSHQAGRDAVFLQQQLADELAKRKSAQYDLIKQAKLACDQQEQLAQKEQELDKLRAELARGNQMPGLRAKTSNGLSEYSAVPGKGGSSTPTPVERADSLVGSRSNLKGSVISAATPEARGRETPAPLRLMSPEMRSRSLQIPAGFSFMSPSHSFTAAPIVTPQVSAQVEGPSRRTLHGLSTRSCRGSIATDNSLASVASAQVAQTPLESPRQRVYSSVLPSSAYPASSCHAWGSPVLIRRNVSPASSGSGVQRRVSTSTQR
eukprot:TRINITY_DN45980_c0_g1_i1.p1 TRINITY_DN45980_c0_g1~~TRINITY_DN45980_c0_g1_i1.p1  ORF type:complete len:349 (-),score=62.58 TRINITY_DN45980_c0_g1_i1:527-1549(-)